MSHTKLRPFIVKVSVLGYFPLLISNYNYYNNKTNNISIGSNIYVKIINLLICNIYLYKLNH